MVSDLIFRLRSLFRRSAVENELDEELRFHLEEQVDKHVRSGLTREEAMRQTRLEFGGLGRVKEDCRESRGITFLETTARDIRYALRQLLRTPAFTITVLLTLALGIGANAAIFTLVNAVLLKKLPVADPGSLVRLGDNNDCCVGSGNRQDGDFAMFSTDTYEQLKKNVPEFEELAAMQAGFWGRPIIARRDGAQGAARSVEAEFVSGNYFRTFGLQPQAGRLLMVADDTQGAPMTAVMSYEAWQRNYAGDASLVGSTFWINTKPVTIVGIAPEGFYGDRMSVAPAEFYLPIESMPVLANAPYVHDPEQDWLYIVGRVMPGVAIAPLQEKVTALLRHALATDEEFSSEQGKTLLKKVHVVLTPGGAGIQAMQEWYGSKLHLLMWIASLVLLIACANIANLLLLRGMARRAEISMRAALGAMRGRIIRQLLTESIVLAGMGGIVGLGVAYAGARMLLMLAFPGAHSVPIHAGPSLSVLAEQHANDGDGNFCFATWTGGGSGWTFAGAAGCCRIVPGEPEKTRGHRPQARCEEPLYRAHQPSDCGLYANPTGGIVPDHGGALPCAAGRDEGGHRLIHAHGRQQQRLGSPGAGTSLPGCLGLSHSGECGIF